jgi:hypothetical protein
MTQRPIINYKINNLFVLVGGVWTEQLVLDFLTQTKRRRGRQIHDCGRDVGCQSREFVGPVFEDAHRDRVAW